MLIKKIIYNIYINFFKFFCIVGCKFNFPYLSAISIYFTKFYRKEIFKNNSNKILFVLYRATGVPDIYSLDHRKKLNNKFNVIFINRDILSTIFFQFNNKKKIKIQKPYNKFEPYKYSKNYIKFTKKVFIIFKKFYGNKKITFLSFNFDYPTEKPLRELSQEKKIKFILWYKECVNTLNQIRNFNSVYEAKKFSNISVYNKETKNFLINYGKIKKNKIDIIGFPRAIFSKKLKKKSYSEEKRLNVLFYYFEHDRGFGNQTQNEMKRNNWMNLRDDVVETLFELAKNYHNKMSITIKSKKFDLFSDYSRQIMNENLYNLKFLYGGTGHQLLNNADLVISFNTSATYESMVAEKKIIVPLFKNFQKKKYKDAILKVPKQIIVNSKIDLREKIEESYMQHVSKKKNKNKNKNNFNLYRPYIKKYFGDYYKSDLLGIKFINKSF